MPYCEDWDSPRSRGYDAYCRRCGEPIDVSDGSGLCWACQFDTGDVAGELNRREAIADGGANNG